MHLFFCREIRADKERQRIIRTGRNKFNTKPKDVSLLSECVLVIPLPRVIRFKWPKDVYSSDTCP